MKKARRLTSNLVRSFVLGVEDSLVSTVGLLSGIAAAGTSRSAIILTGFILIFVEAFSMAVGELLADTTVREFEQHHNIPLWKARMSAVVMFGSYLSGGFLVLSPYIFFDGYMALLISISLSLCMLFILGIMTAELSRVHPLRKAFSMVIVGGLTILIGVSAGFVIQSI